VTFFARSTLAALYFLQLFAACLIRNQGGREPQVKRTASAEWRGDLKTGKGTVSTASGVLEKSQ